MASIADLRISHLVELISSNSVAPGAGAAGAVTLALAAACAGKAVSISLKHTEHPHLRTALTRLEELARHALDGADEDVAAFLEWMRDKSADSYDDLIESEARLACQINALLVIIRDVEGFVRPNMAGDLMAAKALAGAARTIQMTNEAEAKMADEAHRPL